MAINTITGRVIGTVRHGATINGNPMLSVMIDSYTGPGSYGIVAVPRDRDAFTCYECRRSWREDTPAGRCPWEYQHGDYSLVRIMNDSGIVYGIENQEYRDTPHTFTLTPAGRIRNVKRA